MTNAQLDHQLAVADQVIFSLPDPVDPVQDIPAGFAPVQDHIAPLQRSGQLRQIHRIPTVGQKRRHGISADDQRHRLGLLQQLGQLGHQFFRIYGPHLMLHGKPPGSVRR